MARFNKFAAHVGACGLFETTGDKTYVVVLRPGKNVDGKDVINPFPVIVKFGDRNTAIFPTTFTDADMDFYADVLEAILKDTSYPSVGYRRGAFDCSTAAINYDKEYPLGKFIKRVMIHGVEDLSEVEYKGCLGDYYSIPKCMCVASKSLDFSTSLKYKEFADLVEKYPLMEQYNYVLPSWFKPISRDIPKGSIRFVSLAGSPGTGKTDNLVAFACQHGWPYRQCVGNFADAFELIGQKQLVSDGLGASETRFISGPLLECYKYGGLFIVDESNYAPNTITPTFNQMVDGSVAFLEKSTGELVPRHPNFVLAFTYNPGARGSIKEIDSLSSRISMKVIAPDLTLDDFVTLILRHYPNLDKPFAKELAVAVGPINNWAKQLGSTSCCTIRQLLSFCSALDSDITTLADFSEEFMVRVTNPVMTCNVNDLSRVTAIYSSAEYKSLIEKIYSKYTNKTSGGIDYDFVMYSDGVKTTATSEEFETLKSDASSIIDGMLGDLLDDEAVSAKED